MGVPGRPDLYKHEILGVGTAGTVAVYTCRTFHRATQLTAPRGARYTLHINVRLAGNEWQSRRSWLRHANTPAWQAFVEHASPLQLALFGWPPPGHPIWTQSPAFSIATPGIDLKPWRRRMGEEGDSTAGCWDVPNQRLYWQPRASLGAGLQHLRLIYRPALHA